MSPFAPARWFRSVPDDPFYQPRKPLRLPRDMVVPPILRESLPRMPVDRRSALLINPFYPKDPHASFGKHVLTPTLALTSVAAGTPGHWRDRYWDENLLQGPPPSEYVPEAVGITVHLTFAERAYALAKWYRGRGSKVVLGGLHVLSCPEEAIPHADAIVVGDGVQVWPRLLEDVERGELQPRYAAMYEGSYDLDPAPRRKLCRELRAAEKILSAAVTLDSTDDPSFLTPYPGTPLFRQMASEYRILRRDWAKCDTAPVVFRPKHMTPEGLALGYDWLYRRLFSPASVWRRRPRQVSAVLPYLAMSILSMRPNRLWRFLIRHRPVHKVWSPLVHRTWVRHPAFRKRLARESGREGALAQPSGNPRYGFTAGV